VLHVLGMFKKMNFLKKTGGPPAVLNLGFFNHPECSFDAEKSYFFEVSAAGCASTEC
jgi:hypothetical protein